MLECSIPEPVKIQYEKTKAQVDHPCHVCAGTWRKRVGWSSGRADWAVWGKWQWPRRGALVKEGVFSSRIQGKGLIGRGRGWSDAPGFPVAGSSLMSSPCKALTCRVGNVPWCGPTTVSGDEGCLFRAPYAVPCRTVVRAKICRPRGCSLLLPVWPASLGTGIGTGIFVLAADGTGDNSDSWPCCAPREAPFDA